jgi:hypothetical protein
LFSLPAGAGMVNHLMIMPTSSGLFHRAISQRSSTGIAPLSVIDRHAGFEPSGSFPASECPLTTQSRHSQPALILGPDDV